MTPAAATDPKQKEALKSQEKAEMESAARTPQPKKMGGHEGESKQEHKAGETTGGKAADASDDKAKKKETDAKAEERAKLPGEVIKQFKDADLSDVTVIKNSAEAKAKKVEGFATHDQIHIAPGVDELKVMRHEAAHVVQFRKGAAGDEKKDAGKEGGGGHDSKEKNEAAANKAEGGAATNAKDLGTAKAGEARHKEKAGGEHGKEEGGPNDHGAPTVQFNGMNLTGISGKWAKKIEPESGVFKDGLKLWEVGTFWPIPCFPVAGVDVSSEGLLKPTAELSAEGGYKWNKEEKCFSLEGVLGASLGGQLSASVLGGLAIGFVGARVGVGIEAAGILSVTAKAEKKIALKYYYERKAVAVELTPLELSIKADVKLDVSLAAFAHSWFGNKKKSWNLASFNIASFEAKWPISVEMATDGIKTHCLPVTEKKFAWGSPPKPEGGEGAKE